MKFSRVIFKVSHLQSKVDGHWFLVTFHNLPQTRVRAVVMHALAMVMIVMAQAVPAPGMAEDTMALYGKTVNKAGIHEAHGLDDLEMPMSSASKSIIVSPPATSSSAEMPMHASEAGIIPVSSPTRKAPMPLQPALLQNDTRQR